MAFGGGCFATKAVVVMSLLSMSLFTLLACPYSAGALDAQAIFNDVKQRVSDQLGGQRSPSDRVQDAAATAQRHIEDVKKNLQDSSKWEGMRDDAPGVWQQVKDSVGAGSEGASEAFASATSGGKTKTAYQRGKDGSASAHAYASDAAEAMGQQAEAAKRAASRHKKSAWEKAKDFVGGSGMFVHAEAAPTPVSRAYEDVKEFAGDLYASATGSARSARASASNTYYQALDTSHQAYDKAVKKAQAQYSKASQGSSDAGKAAKEAYDKALTQAKSAREAAHKQAQQAYDKAAKSSSAQQDRAGKTLNSALDSARSVRDKAYRKAEAAYDRAVASADATQADASKAYEKGSHTARQAYTDALSKAQSIYDEATARAAKAGSSVGGSASQAGEKVKDAAAHGYDRAAEGASEAYDAAANLADEASKKLHTSLQDYSKWSSDALEKAQSSMRQASQEVSDYINAKTSSPTSSTEDAYRKAKKNLTKNFAAARARVSEALGVTTKEADSHWAKLSKQWDKATDSAKKTLNVQWGSAQKSQKNLGSWLTEAQTSLEELYTNAATEAEKKWGALKKVSAEAADKVEL